MSDHKDHMSNKKVTVKLGKVGKKSNRRITVSFEAEPSFDLTQIKSVAGKKVILPFKSTYSSKEEE